MDPGKEVPFQIESQKDIQTSLRISASSGPKKNDLDVDVGVSSGTSISSLDIQSGRPDLSAIIGVVVKNASRDEAVIVAACGPRSMIGDTRNSVARIVGINGPSVTLHVEEFGWA